MTQQFKLFGLICLISLFGCSKKGKVDSTKRSKVEAALAYRKNIKANIDLTCYDQYTYKMNKPQGALIGPNVVATSFSEIRESYSVRAHLLGANVEPMMSGYYLYDIPGNLLLMKISGPPLDHPKMASKTVCGDSLYALSIKDGKIKKRTIVCDSILTVEDKQFFRIPWDMMQGGIPLFNKSHSIAGVTSQIVFDGTKHTVLYPAQSLNRLLNKLPKKVERLGKLRFKTNKVYPSNDQVDQFKVVTDQGSFNMRLLDGLPEYQSNFIRLVSDGYYDSLLIHRVLHNFLIQMGASDTKRALPDDPVGWRGPGYTLPMTIQPKVFHKRGMIAASKLPKYKNPHNRSDGSQFYIVIGRTFTDGELDDLEDQKKITFSDYQRDIYKTVGGAPYLDGDYTIFGEVVSGMEVVESISLAPTKKDDRPLNDIRIKTIEILMK